MASFYDLDARFRPLDTWIGPRTRYPRSSQFKATWGSTLKLLKRELGYLSAKGITVLLDVDERHIRQDGYPYANARARSPAVVLMFDSKHGFQRYPCDTYDRWDDNMRAIALSLEALRSVNRWGVAKHGEQYKGWGRLPARATATMDLQAAAAFLAAAAGEPYTADGVIAVSSSAGMAYRAAAKKLHPDVGGGPREWAALQEAKATLYAYHGI